MTRTTSLIQESNFCGQTADGPNSTKSTFFTRIFPAAVAFVPYLSTQLLDILQPRHLIPLR